MQQPDLNLLTEIQRKQLYRITDSNTPPWEIANWLIIVCGLSPNAARRVRLQAKEHLTNEESSPAEIPKETEAQTDSQSAPVIPADSEAVNHAEDSATGSGAESQTGICETCHYRRENCKCPIDIEKIRW